MLTLDRELDNLWSHSRRKDARLLLLVLSIPVPVTMSRLLKEPQQRLNDGSGRLTERPFNGATSVCQRNAKKKGKAYAVLYQFGQSS